MPRSLTCVCVCVAGGQCNAEAQFSDRRWQMTVMDRRGFLFVMGGEEIEGNRRAKQDDVWRSTVSLVGTTTTAKNGISTACPGVRFPSCVSGLSCWPGSATLRANSAATCNTLTQCQLYPDEDSSSSGDYVPLPPPTPSSDSSLSTGVIALIVVIVLAVAAVGAFFLYRRSHAPANAYSRDEGLLSSTTNGASLPFSDAPQTAA